MKTAAAFLKDHALQAFVVALMCVLVPLALHIRASNEAFQRAYLKYSVAAIDADTAAYVPTAGNNPIRKELNTIMVQILQDPIESGERLSKAKRGRELLQGTQAQIDAITPKLENMQAAVTEMEDSLSFGDGLFQRGDPQRIIALAKERASAIQDIRALQYRASFQTGKIFDRLIAENGRLTNTFIKELNSELPSEEESFIRLQNLYSDLPRIASDSLEAYADFKTLIEGDSKGAVD